MKRLLHLGCLGVFVLFCAIGYGQTTVTIGTGTAFTEKYPMNGYYNNGWANVIYTASEIRMSGTLSQIAFYVDNAPSNFVMDNQKIYVRHTSSSSYSSTTYPGTSGYTLVYDGSISFSGAGWKTITLSSVFTYNGQDNLEFLFENRDGSWNTGFPYFRYSSVSSTRTRRDYKDADFPSTCYVCATANTIPNIQLTIQDCAITAGSITATPTTVLPGNTTELSLTGNTSGTSIQWQQSTDNTNFTNISGATSASYTATLLQTKYYRALVGLDGCYKATASQQVTVDLSSIVTKTIGTGTSTSEKYPFNNYYDYSWANMIYKASEINGSGNLSRLLFHVSNAPALQTFQNQKIYVRTTTATAYTTNDYPTTSGFTMVYNGPMTYNGTGWVEVVFDQQFYYNGTDNLEFLFENHAGVYTMDYPIYFTSTVAENRTRRDYKDGNFPLTCNFCALTNKLMDIQMKFLPCSSAPTLSASQENFCLSGSSTLTVTNAVIGTIQWQSSTDNVTFTDISGATGTTYTTPTLSETTYYKAKLTYGSCPVQYSSVKTITVTQVNTGTVSASPSTVNYAGSSSLSVSGQQSGASLQWQFSTDNTTFNDIVGATSGTYSANLLSQTTYYRIKVTSNACTNYSTTVTVTVDESNLTTQTIGNGTVVFDKYPFYGYYDYSWSSMLYKSSEINATGKLAKIAFYVENSPVNETMNNQKIYVRHTTTAEYSDAAYPSATGFTLVYDGPVTYNGSGWKEITLQTQFEYNGVDDLEFLFENRDGSWSSTYPTFRGQSGLPQYRVKRDYSDVNFPATCVNCAKYQNLLNIQLGFLNCGITAGTVSAQSTSVKPGAMVELTLNNPPAGATIQWQKSDDGVNYSLIQGATSANYSTAMTLTSLYFRAVVTSGCSKYTNVVAITPDNCFQTEAAIGTGISVTEKYPFNGYYDYSWSNVIYTPSELTTAGAIGSISFKLTNNPTNFVMNNQKIYARHTTEAGYADATYVGTEGFTLVYEGTITYNGTGWKEIVLQTPFVYNGTDNLEFLFENHDGSYGTAYPTFEYTTGMTDYRMRRDYQDGSFPSACLVCSRLQNVPNIRVKMLAPQNIAGTVSATKTEVCPGSSTTLTVTGHQTGGTTIQWQLSMDNQVFTDIPGAVSTTYTPHLDKDEQYYRVKLVKNTCLAYSTSQKIKVGCSYAKLTHTLTGVNYKAVSGKFYFSYEEEYTGSTLLGYKVYNGSNVLVLSSSSNTLVKQQGTATGNEYGDNRYVLDVNSLTNGTYILEAENDKGEKYYLRFTK